MSCTDLFAEILYEEGGASEVVHGNREVSLDLSVPQVGGDEVSQSGLAHHASHQLSRDGAALPHLRLQRVVQTGNHAYDAPSPRRLRGVAQHQQLHQGIVDVAARCLQHEHVLAVEGMGDVVNQGLPRVPHRRVHERDGMSDTLGDTLS